jgi:hypothetical protein
VLKELIITEYRMGLIVKNEERKLSKRAFKYLKKIVEEKYELKHKYTKPTKDGDWDMYEYFDNDLLIHISICLGETGSQQRDDNYIEICISLKNNRNLFKKSYYQIFTNQINYYLKYKLYMYLEYLKKNRTILDRQKKFQDMNKRIEENES